MKMREWFGKARKKEAEMDLVQGVGQEVTSHKSERAEKRRGF